jgi:hypothetical protein
VLRAMKIVVSEMETGRTDFVGDWVSKDVTIRHRTTTCLYIYICIFAKEYVFNFDMLFVCDCHLERT